jgi:hypothetical protein
VSRLESRIQNVIERKRNGYRSDVIDKDTVSQHNDGISNFSERKRKYTMVIAATAYQFPPMSSRLYGKITQYAVPISIGPIFGARESGLFPGPIA